MFLCVSRSLLSSSRGSCQKIYQMFCIRKLFHKINRYNENSWWQNGIYVNIFFSFWFWYSNKHTAFGMRRTWFTRPSYACCVGFPAPLAKLSVITSHCCKYNCHEQVPPCSHLLWRRSTKSVWPKVGASLLIAANACQISGNLLGIKKKR